MDNNEMKEPNKIQLTQEDLYMGKYIYSILLSQPTILMSWGFESPAVIPLGLKFRVNGFLHTGVVRVVNYSERVNQEYNIIHYKENEK